MSTSVPNKLVSNYVPDVLNSDYEFNRFNKSGLNCIANVLKLMVVSESYSNWSSAAPLIWDALLQRYSMREQEVLCFISSSCWKKDSRIVRHYGLSKALFKDYDIKLDFLREKEVALDGYILFYGIAKLTADNAPSIFYFLSTYESGVLFSGMSLDDSRVDSIIDGLEKAISIKSKSHANNLNIVEAINVILENNSEAIFPYAWNETGDYHLDIFAKSL